MKASAAQEEKRVTPHPASRRALEVELTHTRNMLALQEAKLTKAGADLTRERDAHIAALEREADLELRLSQERIKAAETVRLASGLITENAGLRERIAALEPAAALRVSEVGEAS